jgi:hypothetical protein
MKIIAGMQMHQPPNNQRNLKGISKEFRRRYQGKYKGFGGVMLCFPLFSQTPFIRLGINTRHDCILLKSPL